MLTRLVVGLAVLGAPTLPASAQSIATGDGFAATFPAPYASQALQPFEGARAFTQLVAEDAAGAYVLTFVDWNALEEDADLTLDAQRDAMMARTPGGLLLEERYVVVDGRPARQLRFRNTDGSFLARLVFDRDGKRTFNILMVSAGVLDISRAERFLDSLRFTTRPQPQTGGGPEAGFVATFPSAVRTSTENLAAGPLRQFQAEAEGFICTVGVLDSSAPLDGDPEARLDNARDGALDKSDGAALVYERSLSVDGRPGREFMATLAGDLVLMGRFVLDAGRNRVYTLVVAARRSRFDETWSAAFMDSFRFIEPPAGTR